ncbi:14371_t:CDS:2, partial [Gigaspora rosea]
NSAISSRLCKCPCQTLVPHAMPVPMGTKMSDTLWAQHRQCTGTKLKHEQLPSLQNFLSTRDDEPKEFR